jgi:putative Holliday junction resolvase
MRSVGLDLGTQRIGVAVSDTSGLLASPRTIIERSGDQARDWAEIEAIVTEVGAEVLVVGVPVSLDGRSDRSTATAATAEGRAIGEKLGVAVELQDERLTTALAMRLGHVTAAGDPSGAPRKARRRKAGPRKRRYDADAAALILQSWLDSRRESSAP